MFSDSIDCYQAIGSEAAAQIPDPDWRSLRIECTLDGRSTDMLFEYVDAKGQTAYVTRVGRLPEFFVALAPLVSTPEKGLYKVCRFGMDPTGQYKVDFEY